MGIRTVVKELEAKLIGKSTGFFSKPSGKLERKSYADGGERLKISVRNLKSATDTTAVVEADGVEIAQIPIVDGVGKLDTKTDDANTLPVLEAGQTIEVRVSGVSILKGRLSVD